MDHESSAIEPHNVNSDYGSDIDLVSITTPSDYGSDIDLDAIDEEAGFGSVSAQTSNIAPKTATYTSVGIHSAPEGRDEGLTVHLPGRSALPWISVPPPQRKHSPVEFEHDAFPSRRVFTGPEEQNRASKPNREPEYSTSDLISCSPLEVFRKRKPLSVTDLSSPSWCELQFFFNLVTHGRKPPTAAMKRGTVIHAAMEEQVHTFVPVRVKTKEDRFGLRIWNTIQGVRCLQETGLTRELEVWGLIEGHVVNGVIDEVSFACPEPDLEEVHERVKAEKKGGTLPLGRLSFEQDSTHDAWIGALEPDRRIYIADVKTTSLKSVPTKGSALLRAPRMQLMLYRKLFEALSLNTVDAETVLRRYGMLPLQPFSEDFMLKAGDLRHGQDEISPPDSPSLFDLDEIRSHPNLLSLWSLMIQELQKVGTSFSDLLRVEYRKARSGEILGDTIVVYDPSEVDAFGKHMVEWWAGRRKSKGVDIEDVWKCRKCEFADECTSGQARMKEAEGRPLYRARRIKTEKEKGMTDS